MVVVDVPPVFVLPVGCPVVSRVSRSSAPVGVAVFRLVGARVVLLPGSAALVPDVCPRVPLLACSVAAVPWVELPTAGTATSRGAGETTAVEVVVLPEGPGHHQSVALVVRV